MTIERKDIEAKLREIKSEVDDVTNQTRPVGVGVGVAAIALSLGIAFILGERKARRRATIIEVKRV